MTVTGLPARSSQISSAGRGPFLIASFLLLVMHAPAAYAEAITMGMTPIAYRSHGQLFGMNMPGANHILPNSCPKLTSPELAGRGRVAAEIAVVCNAIFAAGLSSSIEVIHKFPHRRRLNEIAEGRIDVSATTIFPEAVAKLPGRKRPLLSADLIRVNEFEKVVFTLPDRQDVLRVRNIVDLRKFRAVMNKFWVVDMKTLRSMKLQDVVETTKAGLFGKFLRIGRADFTIADPSAAGSRGWAEGLAMVPGVKVALVSPRQIPISPARDDIRRAIDAFLITARSGGQDRIEAVYRRVGFFHPLLSNWKLLNP